MCIRDRYQGVTLGRTGKETGKRHPTLEDNVMVSAGAKVIGSLTIGKHSKIGAGAVVLRDVPPNSTVVGIPGRVVKQNGSQIPQLQHLFNSQPAKAGGRVRAYPCKAFLPPPMLSAARLWIFPWRQTVPSVPDRRPCCSGFQAPPRDWRAV